MEPVTTTLDRENPGNLGGAVFTLALSKADSQIPSTYFRIAKALFSATPKKVGH